MLPRRVVCLVKPTLIRWWKGIFVVVLGRRGAPRARQEWILALIVNWPHADAGASPIEVRVGGVLCSEGIISIHALMCVFVICLE